MTLTAKISAMNSIIFIDDGGKSETPLAWEAKPPSILATSTCISVRTLMQFDGDTTVWLGHVSEVDPGRKPSFEQILETPSGQIFVTYVDERLILFMVSGTTKTRIVIWTNHPIEPDEILIGYERA